jgi:hypothetical protein
METSHISQKRHKWKLNTFTSEDEAVKIQAQKLAELSVHHQKAFVRLGRKLNPVIDTQIPDLYMLAQGTTDTALREGFGFYDQATK